MVGIHAEIHVVIVGIITVEVSSVFCVCVGKIADIAT